MKHSLHVGRILLSVYVFVLLSTSARGQTPLIEKLRAELKAHTAEDTLRVNRLNTIAFELRNKIPKESGESSEEALELSRKINYPQGEAIALMALGFFHRHKGQFEIAAKLAKEGLGKFIELKDTANQIASIYNLSFINSITGHFTESFTYSAQALRLAEQIKNTKWMILCKTQMGNNLGVMGETVKSKSYLLDAMHLADSVGDIDGVEHCLTGLGRIAELEKKPEEARKYYRRKVEISIQTNDYQDAILGKLSIAGLDLRQGRYDSVFLNVPRILSTANKQGFTGVNTNGNSMIARAFLLTNKPDSAIKYGLKALLTRAEKSPLAFSQNVNQVLGQAYSKKGQFKEAFQYLSEYVMFKDSLNESEAIRNIAAIQFTYDLDKKQSEIDLLAKNQALIKSQSDQQQRMLWFTGLGIILLIAMLGLLWRINVRRNKINLELNQQQQELKAAQSLLIQSEKMASLGELTAGIAHEIQNPLNFVNNFSDLNKELIDDLESELSKGNKDEAKSIAASIRENEIKISHHGKRADSIVKGMLEHSRSGSAVKEPTNINALAEEYMKLAFHGHRAKDASFNATTKTQYDNSIGNVSVIRQDIGRVLLNLLTNAFYAVTEKKKSGVAGYEPAVTLTTSKGNSIITVTVKDNGNGVPEKVLDKIFQPFFTTKPAGQGTGLGLSLSYDIVKAHGGELKVTTTEGKGTEFIVQLPCK